MRSILRVKYLLSFCFLMFAALVFSQQAKVKNIPTFENKPYHFGFILGYNTADFYSEVKPDFFSPDSILSVIPNKQPGFNMYMLSTLHVNKNLYLRFSPGIAIQDRSFNYTFLHSFLGTYTEEKRVDSYYIDFPLNLKYRTDRLNNFAAYALVGGKYTIDVSSQADVNNDNSNRDEIVIKTSGNDYGFEVGGGVEFFLLYFKFGIELKTSVGLKNILIQDDTIYSRPFESLRSKIYVLSFTFEV